MLVNSQVKYIQSLGHKKFRDADGVFVAEGPKIVIEMLESDNCILVNCYATAEWVRLNKTALNGRDHLAVEADEKDLARISSLVTPNQVVAIFKKPVFPNKAVVKNWTILLDTIQDPGNMGTILRTADWFGIHLIVASKDSADVFNPKVVQSAMGSLIRVQVIYADIEEYIHANPGIPVFASSLEGEDMLENLTDTHGLLLMGNESKGISDRLERLATKKNRIPRYGGAESLNVAVATGILLSRIVEISRK
jgi:TrmH family RNA methyltransferase